LNNSWGFHAGDHDWKTPGQVIDLLATAANGRGNLLLNIGPMGDGTIPPESVRILKTVGQWIRSCGECVFDTDIFDFDLQKKGDHRSDWTHAGTFTAKNNSLYLLARRWIGGQLMLTGIECLVRKVTLLRPCRELAFSQMDDKVVVTGLPLESPDPVCPVIRFDCDRPPSLYLTAGMRIPRVPHPHYDPCSSDIGTGNRPDRVRLRCTIVFPFALPTPFHRLERFSGQSTQ
jgi:alpha-L-fucosidase